MEVPGHGAVARMEIDGSVGGAGFPRASAPTSFRLLLETNPLPMWVYERESQRFLEVNEAAIAHYGYSRDRFLAMRLGDIRPLEELRGIDDIPLAEKASFARSGPWRHRTASGDQIDVEVTSHVLTWDGLPAVLVAVHDLDASSSGPPPGDVLGRLAGPPTFLEDLQAALDEPESSPAVITIGLERLERIAGIAGVTAMYALMEKVARRLDQACAAGDTLVRLSSTTFAVLHRDLGQATAEAVASDILGQLVESLELPGLGEVTLTPALGVRVAEPGETDAEVVLRDAMAAMDLAVAGDDRRLVVFDPTIRNRARMRFELEQALRRGLHDDQFRLHYQPVVDVASGAVLGFEALLRWERPGHGLVGPAEIIDVAEPSGLILALGDWVLEQGLSDLARIRTSTPDAFVAINVSPYQLRDRSLADHLVESCGALGIDPSAVCLELTETAIVSARAKASSYDELVALRATGAKIAIDDFGTGYSALSYLKDLPVDIVKIDRSFVSGLEVVRADGVLIEAVTRLAHALELTVVAEGVETTHQLDALRAFDVDAAQGYLFARPAPLDVVL